MHEALKGLTPITYEQASQLKHDSERLFATAFLAWFERWPHLYYEPFKVNVPGVGNTIPDFATELGARDLVLYEVTITANTSRKPRKIRQRTIYDQYTELRKHVKALEINGNALRCADTTMEILERFYRDRISVDEAQQKIDQLGRDTRVFQATLLRELSQI